MRAGAILVRERCLFFQSSKIFAERTASRNVLFIFVYFYFIPVLSRYKSNKPLITIHVLNPKPLFLNLKPSIAYIVRLRLYTYRLDRGGIIDLFRIIVSPPRERWHALRATPIAPRATHFGSSASCTGTHLLPASISSGGYRSPSPPHDERAVSRSLDVWRDLRRGTHGVGSCLLRPSMARAFCVLFCRGAV